MHERHYFAHGRVAAIFLFFSTGEEVGVGPAGLESLGLEGVRLYYRLRFGHEGHAGMDGAEYVFCDAGLGKHLAYSGPEPGAMVKGFFRCLAQGFVEVVDALGVGKVFAQGLGVFAEGLVHRFLHGVGELADKVAVALEEVERFALAHFLEGVVANPVDEPVGIFGRGVVELVEHQRYALAYGVVRVYGRTSRWC